MAKRESDADKPAQKPHRLRMSCLVLVGVTTMVVVGTVFAPERLRQQAAPPVITTDQPSNTPSQTLSVAFTPEATSTPSSQPITEGAPVLSTTTELLATEVTGTEADTTTPTAEPSSTSTAMPSPTRTIRVNPLTTATRTPTLVATTATPTQTRTPTPTLDFILATNTAPPLLIVTNTPSTSGG